MSYNIKTSAQIFCFSYDKIIEPKKWAYFTAKNNNKLFFM